MQDIHSLGSGGCSGGGGRLFGGNSGGDRRLRPHHHTPQAMKCPRCESLNTKFCYYNNYNLSQPRHFCKSCRRYWTKGGVLRNVPVGGGCRKTKRSKSKSNSNNNSSSHSGVRKSTNSQNSSSDSSTVTEKTTTMTTTTVTTNPVFSFHETTTTGFVNIPNSVTRNPSFDPQFPENNNSMFPEIAEIGSFTSLITSSSTSQISQIPLGYNDISPFRTANQTEWLETEQQVIGDELKVQSPLGGFTEDWNNGTDQTLFDLTGTVDQSYWNQANWNENDNDQDHQLNYLR